MRKDSGVLMVGVVLLLLGLLACFKGFSGETMYAYSTVGLPSKTSPSIVILAGVFLLSGGIYFIYQSGYFGRNRRS